MLNKNLSKILTIFIFVFSIYLPLFIYNFLLIYNDNKSKSILNNIDIEKKNNEDYFLRKAALEDNFLPNYYPNQIKEFSIKANSKFYPIGSLPNTNLYYCNEGYGLIKYKSDRFGLRNNDKIWDDIKDGANIFLIGDSFAHGACVEDQFTISQVLSNLSGEKVFNLAHGSNDPYEYAAILKTIIKPILRETTNKSWVVLAIYTNDNKKVDKLSDSLLKNAYEILSINEKEKVIASKEYIEDIEKIIKSNYPTSSEKILERMTKIRKPELYETIKLNNKSKFYKFIKENPFYKYITLVYLRDRIKLLPRSSNNLVHSLTTKTTQTELAIQNLAKICIQPCKPVLLFVPNSNIWDEDLKADLYKLQIKKLAKKYDIQFIDGEEVIDKNNPDDFAPAGLHNSKDGYRKIAEHILKGIKLNIKK